MQTWITELKQLGPQNIVLAITGNKSDLEEKRKVSVLAREQLKGGGGGDCHTFTSKTPFYTPIGLCRKGGGVRKKSWDP